MSSYPPRLERHAWRRTQGLPALSVLVGDRESARKVWSRFRGSESVVLQSPLDPRREWLRRLILENDWPARLASLDDRSGLDQPEREARLRSKGRAQLALYLEDHGCPLPEWLLETVLDWMEMSPANLETQLLRESREDVIDIQRALIQLEGVVLPALLWNVEGARSWESDLAVLIDLAAEVPVVDIGIAVTGSYLDEWLSGPESRMRAMVREGRVELTSDQDEMEARTSLHSERGGEARALLAQWGAGEDVVASFECAVSASQGVSDVEGEERARSAAEAFLFRLLGMLPETAGRFELNGLVELPGEARQREIDLLDRERQVAIEVDGYYHFQDPEAYRRDRRKDFALQRGGFLVLRFLADDVVVQLETVLATIREALPFGRPRDVLAGS